MFHVFFQGICDYWTGLQQNLPSNGNIEHNSSQNEGYWDYTQVKASNIIFLNVYISILTQILTTFANPPSSKIFDNLLAYLC